MEMSSGTTSLNAKTGSNKVVVCTPKAEMAIPLSRGSAKAFELRQELMAAWSCL